MSRKQLKAQALKCVSEMTYARVERDFKGVRRWRNRLMEVCVELAAYGYIGAQGWFNAYMNA